MGRSEKAGGPPTINLMSTVNTPNSTVNSPYSRYELD